MKIELKTNKNIEENSEVKCETLVSTAQKFKKIKPKPTKTKVCQFPICFSFHKTISFLCSTFKNYQKLTEHCTACTKQARFVLIKIIRTKWMMMMIVFSLSTFHYFIQYQPSPFIFIAISTMSWTSFFLFQCKEQINCV